MALLPKQKLVLSASLDIVSKELMRQNLDKTIELAEKHGLSEMTMDDISDEVKAVRKNLRQSAS